jgi:dolichyl-phosphate-mannose--protein O-mannosyl transferase
MADIWRKNEQRPKTVIYLILVIAAFAIYYPVISGSPVHNVLRGLLRILRSWAF